MASVHQLAQAFHDADEYVTVQTTFQDMCRGLDIDPTDHENVTRILRENLKTGVMVNLWKIFDKRQGHSDYQDGKPCKGKKVLIIGGGPCGLRMGIELAFLGAEVNIVEKRDTISRHNVLHIWSFLTHDFKAIGCKVFYPKLCVGEVNHVSIRRVQLVLLKVALMLGVQIHAPVSFVDVVEPQNGLGWKAKLDPADHPLNSYEFDVLVGADGKSNTLTGFSRKCFRGKQAIAITANIENKRSRQEGMVKEIPGIFYIFKQEFFNSLAQTTGIELENFVYYKDETHYFVMTARKKSLLAKGVIKKDSSDAEALLAADNIDRDALRAYAREAADFSTNNQLPKNLKFKKNHTGEDDVAIFDFTAMFQANHSCLAIKKQGKTLLQCIVGDTLIEPFWPTGSGLARGFFGVYDAAWLIRNWCLQSKPPLELIAERESVFSLLSQTKPTNIKQQFAEYSIDPATRYVRVKYDSVLPHQVQHLYKTEEEERPIKHIPKRIQPRKKPTKSTLFIKDSDDEDEEDIKPVVKEEVTKDEENTQPEILKKQPEVTKRPSIDYQSVLSWFQETLKPFQDRFVIKDLSASWRDGLAFYALVQLYRPQLCLDVAKMSNKTEEDYYINNKKAFHLIEVEFGVTPVMSADALAYSEEDLDTLALLSYLTQIKECLEDESLPKVMKKNESWKAIRPVKRKNTMERNILMQISSKINMERGFGADDLKRTEPVTRPVKEDKPTEAPAASDEDSNSSGSDAEMSDEEGAEGTAEEKKQKRVSVLAFAANLDKKVEKDQADRWALRGRSMARETCALCKKALFIIERFSLQGIFFHKSCFRCAVCHCMLRLDNYLLSKGSDNHVEFFCFTHGHEQGHFRANWQKGGKQDKQTGKTFTANANMTIEEEAEPTENQNETDSKSHLTDHISATDDSQDTIAASRNFVNFGDQLAVNADEDKYADESDDDSMRPPEEMKKSRLDGIHLSLDRETAANLQPEAGSSESDDSNDSSSEEEKDHYMAGSYSASLLTHHELQYRYDSLQQEQEHLDEIGKEVENRLRMGEDNAETPADNQENTALMGKLVNTLKRKRNLENKEAKLILKMKLMDLHERHKKLASMMTSLGIDTDLTSNIVELENDTSALEKELETVTNELSEIKMNQTKPVKETSA